jgi:hypothetical protein
MIVSPGRGYVFVHIPKTGGTSMALALEARAMRDDILIGDTPKARRRRGRLEGVETAGGSGSIPGFPTSRGFCPQERLAAMFVFTMVRNPWDRLVSYYHWLGVQRFDHPAVRLAKALGFSAFLNHPETRTTFARERYGDYVRGAAAPVFVRLEHLAEDLAPVEAHLGFRLDCRMRTGPNGRGLEGLLFAADAALVESSAQRTSARFGYRFEAGGPRGLCPRLSAVGPRSISAR